MDQQLPILQQRADGSGIAGAPCTLGRDVLEACPVPMIVIERGTTECVIRYVNPAFAHRTGCCAAQIAHHGWSGLHPDEGPERAGARLLAAIRESRRVELALQVHSKDGVTFSATLDVSPIEDPGGGAPRYAVGVLRERGADAAYVSRLEREAQYDPLTGLPNRRLLAQRAGRALTQALRDRHRLAVGLVDLDGFKLLNDTWGHAVGDEALCAVGARLARDLRAGDLVARVGGDEFVLLLQEHDGDFALPSILERICRRIEQPLHLHGRSIRIGCSIGLAAFPADGGDLDTLLRSADRAMYRQKSLHRAARSLEASASGAPIGLSA